MLRISPSANDSLSPSTEMNSLNPPKHFPLTGRIALAIGAIFSLVAEQNASAAPVTAKPADSFVAACGINAHWNYNNVYTSGYTTLRDKVVTGGFRVVRCSATDATTISKMQELAGLGVESIATIDPPTGTRANANYWSNSPHLNVVDYIKQVGTNVIAALEMNNEEDLFYSNNRWHPTDTTSLSNDPNSPIYWAKYLKAETPDTWAALRADPATASLPLIGPSLTTTGAYTAVGDLTGSIDDSCVHHYMSGRHPETGGWGGNGYGSIQWAITYCDKVQSPTAGFVATEGGNSTASAGGLTQWPIFAQGRYIPRYYLLHFMNGFRWICPYELVDEGTSTTDPEQNFGLIYNNLTEKPAYTATKNLLNLLKDPGSSFAPGSLDYTLSGSTANVYQLLLEKADGTFYLCLWLGVQCYDPTNGNTITVPNQAVTLAVPSSVGNATTYTLDDSGNMTMASAPISGGNISLSVSDRVMVVKLVPQYQAEGLTLMRSSGDTYRVITDSRFSGGAGTTLDATAVGDYVTLLVPGVTARTYDVRVGVKKFNTRGIMQLAIGPAGSTTPTNLGAPQDLYNSGEVFTEIDYGNWTPGTSSDKWFWFTVTGKNASSSGYTMAWDYIRLIAQ